MRAERTRRDRRRGFGRCAALLLLSCSVFPDQAVLPASGGNAGQAATGGANGGTTSLPSGGLGGALVHGGDGGDAGSPGGGIDGQGGSDAQGGTDAQGGSDAQGGTVAQGGSDAQGGTVAQGGRDVSGGGGTPTGGAAGNGGAATGGATMGGAGGSGGATMGGAGGSSCANPSVQLFEAGSDAYLSELAREQKTNFGQEPRLKVSGVGGERAHAVLWFDLSALPSAANVLGATLRLELGAASTSAQTVSLYALSQAFDEKHVSWERYNQSSRWVTPGGDTAVRASSSAVVAQGAAAGTSIRMELGDDVRAIARGERPSNGWLLAVADGEAVLEFVSRESAFGSERPTLEVTSCP